MERTTLRTWLLLLAPLITMCSRDKEVSLYSNNGQTIIDSTGQGKDFLVFSKDESLAYYLVYYLGKQTDTIALGHQPVSMFADESNSRYDSARNWNSTQDMVIDIFVDTTMHVGHDATFSHFADSGEDVIDSVKSLKAFPVFIRNMSDSLVMMGTHNFVGYLTREVMDKNGKWIEVERRQRDLCGAAKRNLVMEPGDIIVAKLLRYKGHSEFQFRLKLSMKFGGVEAYRTYSNVFNDHFDLVNLNSEKIRLNNLKK